jgi:hypothetical protein
MRLLNLIKINKIDVKKNFETKYKDTLCHFCRYFAPHATVTLGVIRFCCVWR